MDHKEKARSEMRDRLFREEAGLLEAAEIKGWPRFSALSTFLRGETVALVGGPDNVGKSFFCQNIFTSALMSGSRADYLPLEDDRAELLKRCCAYEQNSYDFLSTDKDSARGRMDWMESDAGKEAMDRYSPHIHPNPWNDGVKPTDEYVYNWMEDRATEGSRYIFIDNLTQMYFGSRNVSLSREEAFVMASTALASRSGMTIVFVIHTKSLHGRPHGYVPTKEDLSGTSLWRKNTHTIAMIQAHDERESRVYGQSKVPGMPIPIHEVEHNRTVRIDKSRHGRGAGFALAFQQEKGAPRFRELGVIVKGKK